jgi:RNA polymerase sporulation-specific sigma factor
MVAELSELELEVLRLYVAGRSYVEIADHVGRHAKSVDNAVQRIKRKLGRSLVQYEAAALC